MFRVSFSREDQLKLTPDNLPDIYETFPEELTNVTSANLFYADKLMSSDQEGDYQHVIFFCLFDLRIDDKIVLAISDIGRRKTYIVHDFVEIFRKKLRVHETGAQKIVLAINEMKELARFDNFLIRELIIKEVERYYSAMML